MLADAVSGRTGLTALLGEHLGVMLPDTDLHLKTESGAVGLRFRTECERSKYYSVSIYTFRKSNQYTTLQFIEGQKRTDFLL